MSYVKIKVKHLLAIVISAAVLFTVPAYLKGYVYYGIAKAYHLAGKDSMANVFYDRAANDGKGTGVRIKAATEKLERNFREDLLSYFNFMILSDSGIMSTGNIVNYKSMEEIDEQYRALSEVKNRNDAYARYEICVAAMNFGAGYEQEAISILNSIDYIKDPSLEEIRVLHIASIYLMLGEMQAAFNQLDEMQFRKYEIYQDYLLEYYYFMTANYDEFKRYSNNNNPQFYVINKYSDTLLKPIKNICNQLPGFIQSFEGGIAFSNIKGNVENNKERDKNKDKETKENTLSGKVTIDGKPMAYAIVILKDEATRHSYSSGIGVDPGVKGIAITDKDGNYKVTNIKDGAYVVSMYVNWNRIRGKSLILPANDVLVFSNATTLNKDVEFFGTEGMVNVSQTEDGKLLFTINPPKKAEYFSISTGEVIESEDKRVVTEYNHITDKIRGNTILLDPAAERQKGIKQGFAFTYAPKAIYPYTIFEPFYHTGKYSYSVTAYDKAGNSLFDSNGIYENRDKQLFDVKANEWTEADKLFIDYKIEQALAGYEKVLESDKENLHALKMLSALYNNGWKYEEGKSGPQGKDYVKAEKYLKMLDLQLPGNEVVKSSLSYIYERKGNYEQALEELKQISSESGGHIAYNYNSARLYSIMGNFKMAEQSLNEYSKVTGYGYEQILMLQILQNKKDQLLDTAEKYDDRYYYVDYVNLIRSYLREDTTHYEAFFKSINSGKIEEAKEIIKNPKNDLEIFYKALLNLQLTSNTQYDEKLKEYTDSYNSVKTEYIKRLMKSFGKISLNSGFGDY